MKLSFCSTNFVIFQHSLNYCFACSLSVVNKIQDLLCAIKGNPVTRPLVYAVNLKFESNKINKKSIPLYKTRTNFNLVNLCQTLNVLPILLL